MRVKKLLCQIVLNNYKSSKNISQTESDVLYKKWSWVGGRSVVVGQRSEDLECVALLVNNNNKMNLDSSNVAAFDQFQLRPNEVVIFRIFRGSCQWMMMLS